MELIVMLVLAAVCRGNLLDRTYLPPPGAKTSGDSDGAIDLPLDVPLISLDKTTMPSETKLMGIDYVSSEGENIYESIPMKSINREGSETAPLNTVLKSVAPSFPLPMFSCFGSECDSSSENYAANSSSSSNIDGRDLVTNQPHETYFTSEHYVQQTTNMFDEATAPSTGNFIFSEDNTSLLTRQSNATPYNSSLSSSTYNEFSDSKHATLDTKVEDETLDSISYLHSTSATLVPSLVSANTDKTLKSARPQSNIDAYISILKYESDISPDGKFSFDFDTANGIHADNSGNASDGVRSEGSYSYTGDDGQFYSVTYTADENGYKPIGDHLPTPPPIPVAIQRVIELSLRNKAAGLIPDRGLYDASKYGYKKINDINEEKQSSLHNNSNLITSTIHDVSNYEDTNLIKSEKEHRAQNDENIKLTPESKSNSIFTNLNNPKIHNLANINKNTTQTATNDEIKSDQKKELNGKTSAIPLEESKQENKLKGDISLTQEGYSIPVEVRYEDESPVFNTNKLFKITDKYVPKMSNYNNGTSLDSVTEISRLSKTSIHTSEKSKINNKYQVFNQQVQPINRNYQGYQYEIPGKHFHPQSSLPQVKIFEETRISKMEENTSPKASRVTNIISNNFTVFEPQTNLNIAAHSTRKIGRPSPSSIEFISRNPDSLEKPFETQDHEQKNKFRNITKSDTSSRGSIKYNSRKTNEFMKHLPTDGENREFPGSSIGNNKGLPNSRGALHTMHRSNDGDVSSTEESTHKNDQEKSVQFPHRNQQNIKGETFSPGRKPPRYDPESGYHY